MDATRIPNDMISAEDAAKLLKVSGTTIRSWCASGKLPAFRVGGRLRVSQTDVLAQVQRVQTAGPTIPTRAEVAARDAETDRVLKQAGVRR